MCGNIINSICLVVRIIGDIGDGRYGVGGVERIKVEDVVVGGILFKLQRVGSVEESDCGNAEEGETLFQV